MNYNDKTLLCTYIVGYIQAVQHMTASDDLPEELEAENILFRIESDMNRPASNILDVFAAAESLHPYLKNGDIASAAEKIKTALENALGVISYTIEHEDSLEIGVMPKPAIPDNLDWE